MAAMAIRSALTQDFKDLEVIVSDNSSPAVAQKVEATVADLADPRVKYVRPPAELAMGENWDFALRQARGEYVGYLTDRMAFKRNALLRLSQEITTNRPDVISYSSSGILEVAPPYRLQRPRFTGQIEAYESSWVVGLLSKSVAPWGAPCMLNSFASRRLLAEMTSAYGAFMASVAPDLAFCVHVLDHIDRFTYLDLPLMISHGHASSNGAGFGTGRLNEAARDFAAMVERQGGLRFAPIPEIVNNHNIRAHEYGRMRATQKSGRFVELDLSAYCQELAAELDLQGDRASEEDWRRLDDFMQAHAILRKEALPHQSRLKRAAQPVLQAANDWLGINPTNRAVGKFASVDEVLAYDESHPPAPNSRSSGFLRARDRARLEAVGAAVFPGEPIKP
jgi:glycosyltransferase involved in cell wall biosynthesis